MGSSTSHERSLYGGGEGDDVGSRKRGGSLILGPNNKSFGSGPMPGSRNSPTVVPAVPPKWEEDNDHKCCKRCSRSFTVTLRRHHCRRCGHIFCSSCCFQTIRLPHLYGPTKVRVCIVCACPIFHLSDNILQYIQLFLPYSTQDKLLRVSKRFQRLVILPFPKVDAVSTRFSYKEPEDTLHVGRLGHKTIRCTDLANSGQPRAIRVIQKSQMFSRGDWQSLQHLMDTHRRLNHPAFVNLFEVLQTSDSIILVMELIPSSFIPLGRFAAEAKPDEITSCKVAYELLDALSYLHNEGGLVHRNLHPGTVLVDPQANYQVKIVGLAFAKRLKASSSSPSALYSMNHSITAPPRASIGSGVGAGGGEYRPERQVLRPLAEPFAVGKPTTFLYREETSPIRRPPPIQVPRDLALEKKSALYARSAKAREDHGKSEMEKSHQFAEPPVHYAAAGFEDIMLLCASPRGAPRFAAPEVVEMFASRNPLTGMRLSPDALQKWDVFSAGVLLFFLVSHGKTPWTSNRWEVLAITMANGLHAVRASLPPGLTEPLLVLLAQMLAPTAEERCTMRQALQSSVFAEETTHAMQAPPSAPSERGKKKRPSERHFKP